MLLKERKQNILPVILAGVRGELHTAKVIAVIPPPASMHPRPDYQGVEDTRIVLLNRMESAERPLQVFRVKPSAHGQHGTVNVLHVRSEISRLPVVVVGVVPHLIVEQSA